MYVSRCAMAHPIEVREQVPRVSLFSYYVSPGDWTQGIRLGDRYLYLPSQVCWDLIVNVVYTRQMHCLVCHQMKPKCHHQNHQQKNPKPPPNKHPLQNLNDKNCISLRLSEWSGETEQTKKKFPVTYLWVHLSTANTMFKCTAQSLCHSSMWHRALTLSSMMTSCSVSSETSATQVHCFGVLSFHFPLYAALFFGLRPMSGKPPLFDSNI